MKDIAELHESEFDEKPQIVVHVPGVHTLIGEFSDYCKGFSLCGTSSQYLEIAVSVRPDQSVRLISGQSNDRKRFNIQNLKFRREDRWGNYAKGVMAQFVNKGFSISGANVSIAGTLLKNEGQVLSSAMCMGCAMAFNELFNANLSIEQLAGIAYISLATFCAEVSRYVLFFAMTQAREGWLMLFNIQHHTWEYIAFPPFDTAVVALIVESRISPYALKEELSIKRRDSKLAFEKLRILFPSGLLRDISDQDIKDLSVPLTEHEKRTCMYVLSESRMARKAPVCLHKKIW
ncbi:MAG: galactokinase family protein [Sphaerochaetaceae bacterium]|nr:galactokinase family protein [Sphaerochaetaceae bacterium]